MKIKPSVIQMRTYVKNFVNTHCQWFLCADMGKEIYGVLIVLNSLISFSMLGDRLTHYPHSADGKVWGPRGKGTFQDSRALTRQSRDLNPHGGFTAFP